MSRSGWLLCVLLAGCEARTPADAGVRCLPTVIGLGFFPFVPAGIGTPMTVKVGAEFGEPACSMPIDAHVAIRAEVVDPASRLVETKITPGATGAYDRYWPVLLSAATPSVAPDHLEEFDLTFTPTMAGPHHVTVAFDPALGSTQFDVPALVDRRDAGLTYQRLSVPAPCAKVLFEGSSLLCLTPDGVQIIGGSGSFPATNFAVDGYVWSTYFDGDAGTEIFVGELDGGGVQTLASLDLPDTMFAPLSPAVGNPIAVRQNKAMLAGGGDLVTFTFAGTVQQDVAVPLGFVEIYSMQWRGGDRALVTASIPGLLQPYEASICDVRLGDGGADCTVTALLGDDGQWLWSSDGGTVTAWQLQDDGGLLQRSAAVDVPPGVFFSPFGTFYRMVPVVPGLATALVMLRLDPDPVLELYPLPPDPPVGGIAYSGMVDGRYWESYNDGTLAILAP